jgi:hypothetical protein
MEAVVCSDTTLLVSTFLLMYVFNIFHLCRSEKEGQLIGIY